VAADRFRFGDFTIDVATALVYRHGVRVPLQPQPSRLLVFLVQRAGAVVTRDEIRAHVWGDTVVEFDQNINYCIRQIRTALGDTAATIVQTVPRQGYRFTAAPAREPRADVGRFATVRAGRRLLTAASLALAFGGGFVCGFAVRERPDHPLTFVYQHITGEANCPYMRFLSPLHRSS
jgi:DNA-binding winged helix-turn-helix (wHTH) protein